MRPKRIYNSAAVAALMTMMLTACGPNGAEPMMSTEALPLAAGDATSIAPAPAVEALPAAPATRVVYVSQPADSYQYVDDAYVLSDTIGDAPPDYGFDYDDSHPWAWRTADNALRLYESSADGDRYYYYRPGESDPYLVRDAGYSYAYAGGNLVTVYDDRGRALDRYQAERRAEYAGRYLARARALEAAAARDRRQQVVAANWSARQAQIRRDNARWAEERRQSQQWQAYHARQEAQENSRQNAQQRARLQAERDRRQRESVAFNHWRDNGYKGQPPRAQVAEKTAPRRDWQFWKRQDAKDEHAQKLASERQKNNQQQQAREDQARKDQAREQQARNDREQRADQDRRQLTAHEADQKQQAARQAEDRKHDAQQAREQASHQDQMNRQQAANRQTDAQKKKAEQAAEANRQKAAREAQAREKAREEARTHPNNRQRPEDRRG